MVRLVLTLALLTGLPAGAAAEDIYFVQLTDIQISPDPGTAGEPFDVTLAVVSSSSGDYTPDWMVEANIDAAGVHCAAVQVTPSMPPGRSVATISCPGLPAGTHAVQIDYWADFYHHSATVAVPYAVNGATPPLAITTDSLPDANVSQAYSQTLAASGGDGSYSFSATGLPPGMAISAAGVISGASGTLGDYEPVFTVSDASSNTAARTIPLSVVKYTTTVAATQSAETSVSGESVTFDVTVSGGLAPHTGTIQAFAGGVLVETWPIGGPNTVSMQISTLPVGSNAVTFRYSGNGHNEGSESPPITHTVTPPPLPQITSVPIAVFESGGARVINGFNLADATVTVGGAPVTPTSNTATQIALTVPPGTDGAVPLVVTTPYGSASQTLYYFRTMTITGVSPAEAPLTGGTTVVITGTGFRGSYADVHEVSLAGRVQSNFIVNSDTQITVTTGPAPLASGVVMLSKQVSPAGAITLGGVAFHFADLPGVVQTSLPNATLVQDYEETLTGQGGTGPYTFSATGLPNGLAMTAGGTISGAPLATGTFQVAVTITDQDGESTTATLPLTVGKATPTLSLVVPPVSIRGQAVLFTAQLTGAYMAGGTVEFLADGTPFATVPVNSGMAGVLAGLSQGTRSITAVYSGDANHEGATSPASTLQVLPPAPVISAISPDAGLTTGGQAVTLTGQHFSGASVTLGGAAVTVTSRTATSLSFTAPADSDGPQTVVVTTEGGTATTAFYYYRPITIGAISPDAALTDGGTTLTITGSGFTGAYADVHAVSLAGHPQATFTVVSDTQITVETGAASPASGAVEIVKAITPTANTTQSGLSFRFFTLPSVIETTIPAATYGTAYAQTVTAQDGAGGYAFSATGLPPGLDISGDGAITGTPTAAGSYPVQITVTDSDSQTGTRTITLEVAKATPFLTLAGPAGTIDQGSVATFTATLTGATSPTGTVAFFNGATYLGTAPVIGTTATFATTALPPGRPNIKAEYSGDDNHVAVHNSISSFTVRSQPLTLATTALADAAVGEAYSQTLTATGAQGGATFAATGLPAGLTLTGGTITGTPTAAGSFPVEITVSDLAPRSVTTTLTLTVAKATPTLTLAQSAAASDFGDSVTLTATLAGGAAPGGTVTFFAGGTLLGTQPVTGGAAVLATTELPGGSLSLTASYAGDANNAAATAAAISHVVTVPAPVITSISPPYEQVTGGSFVTVFGSNLTGATLTLGGASVPPAIPGAGSVSFIAPPGADGPAELVLTTPGGSATATFYYYRPVTITSITPDRGPAEGGTTVVITGSGFTGVYSDVALVYLAGIAQPSFTVDSDTQITVTTAAGGPGSGLVQVGKPITPHLSISPAQLSYTYYDPPRLAETSLSGATYGQSHDQFVSATGTVGPYGFSITGLPLGLNPGPRSFSGIPMAAGTFPILFTVTDGNGDTGTTTLPLIVAKAQPTLAVVGPVSGGSYAGVNTSFTAMLSGGMNATGMVEFFNGADSLGTAPLVGIGATLTTNALPLGTHSITAVYAGDGNHLTASAAALAHTVTLAPPVISNVNPPDILIAGGSTHTITGSNLGGATAVTVGGAAASFTVNSNSNLSFTAPPGASGATTVEVVTPGGSATRGAYYFAPPVITGFSPARVEMAGGTLVTITGSGFTGTPYSVSHAWAGGASVAFTVVSDTEIQFTAPASAVAGLVDVVLRKYYSGGQTFHTTTGSTGFGYLAPAPAVETDALADGTVGAAYSQTLAASDGEGGVTFTATGLPAGLALAADGTLSGTPEVAGSFTLEVTATDEAERTATATLALTVAQAQPALSLSAPATALRGADVTLTATLSGGLNPTGSVSFHDGATLLGSAAVSAGSATLVATLAEGVRAITATYAGDANHEAATAPAATVGVGLPAPVITALSRNSGTVEGGENLLIMGTDLDGLVSVTIGGVPATIWDYSQGWIASIVPPGADGPAAIIVTTSGGTASGTWYYYRHVGPAVLSPETGPDTGGTVVTITGTGFTGAYGNVDTVTFGGAAASFTVDSDTQITATAPAGAPGPADVTVSKPVAPGEVSDWTLSFDYYDAGQPLLLTQALPAGTVGLAYSAPLEGERGAPPYAFAVAPLPAGLGVSGAALQGIPETAGTIAVRITLTDDAGASVTGGWLSLVIAKASPTLALSSGAPAPVAGESVTFTATLSGAVAPTGTVEFFADAVSLGTAPVAAGIATLAAPALAAGTHAVTASYAGDANHEPAAAPPLTQTVLHPAPAVTGFTPHFAAAGAAGVHTLTGAHLGTVSAVTVGGSPAAEVTAVADGQITFRAPVLAAGAHAVSLATPGGTAGTTLHVYDPIVIASVSPAVAPAAGGTTLTLTGSGFTGLAGDVDRILFGGTPGSSLTVVSDTVMTVVTPALADPSAPAAGLTAVKPVAPAQLGSPAAEIQGTFAAFALAPQPVLATASLAAGVAGDPYAQALAATGGTEPYTFTASGLPAGLAVAGDAITGTPTVAGSFTVTLTVEDANGFTATALLPLAIAQRTPTLVLASSAASAEVGTAVTLSATLTGGVGATGTVTFLNGSDTLGTAPLTGGSAQLVAEDLPVGSHTLTAVYGGDGEHEGATAPAVTQTITARTPTLVLASSAASAEVGTAVTLTATLSGGVGATGTVTFLNGTDTLGTAPLADGSAQLVAEDLPVGSHTLTAVYGGDAEHEGATSAPLVQTILPPSDTTPPEVTLAALQGPAGGVYTAEITFSEPVTGFEAADLELVNATATLSGSGADYLATLTPLAEGALGLAVPADVAQDAAGNGNLASAPQTAVHDVTPPTWTVSGLSGPVDGVYTLTVSFSEPVAGFDAGVLAVQNAGVTVTGSGAVYVVTITPDGEGPVSVTLPAQAVTDLAGNGSAGGVVTAFVPPMLDPTVTLASAVQAITSRAPITVTATFSEAVTGLAPGDVTVTGGAVTAVQGLGAVHAITIRPDGTADVVVSIPAGVTLSVRGAPNRASAPLSIASQVVSATQDRIATFMARRADALLASQPDLIARFQARSQTDGGLDLATRDGNGSLRLRRSWSSGVWTDVTGRWSREADPRTEYLFGVIGADAMVGDRLMVGAMLQFDHAREADPSGFIRGQGWMAGPYLAGRAAEHPLYFEASLIYGRTRNRISIDGGATVSQFATRRWLAQARLAGEIVLEGVTLIPNGRLSYTADRQLAYLDGYGNTIPEQSLSLFQGELGLDFRRRLTLERGELVLTGGAAVIVSEGRGAGGGTVDPLRGRLRLGLDYTSRRGLTFAGEVSLDGLGSARGITPQLGLNWRYDF